jgi:peptidoglycan biosynthesis protein MviN/MurJ (putative lipid II flippase)
VALVGSLGLPAIGLAIALAAWAEALLLLAVLRRREGAGLDLGALASVLARILVAAVVAGGVGYVVLQSLGALVPGGADADLSSLAAKAGLLAQAVIVTLAGGAAYAAVSWVLGVRELRTIVSILADLIRRRGRS